MSYAVQTPLLEPVARPVDRARVDASTVVVTALLLGAAGWLVRWWWGGEPLVPATWALPSAQALFVLPGAGVVGLLAVRVALGRERSAVAQRLLDASVRWAAVWAALSVVWLGLTLVDLYGGVDRLVHADNLAPVLSASDGATSQLISFQVALLVACFGSRFVGWSQSLGLLALTAATTLAAFPLASAAHTHDVGERSALVPAMAALQVVGLIVWVGALLALPYLVGPALRLRRHLVALGRLTTAAALTVGATAVVAGLFLPSLPTPPVIAATGLVFVGLVVHVGRRHRQRVLDVVSSRGGLALVAVAAGETAVLAAVVLVGCWLPTGG